MFLGKKGKVVRGKKVENKKSTSLPVPLKPKIENGGGKILTSKDI